jgi:hypothetical protein
MQARVEVEVRFVNGVRPEAEDGREVAGGHAEGVDRAPPVVLLLHKNAVVVGQHEGGDVGLFAQLTLIASPNSTSRRMTSL